MTILILNVNIVYRLITTTKYPEYRLAVSHSVWDGKVWCSIHHTRTNLKIRLCEPQVVYTQLVLLLVLKVCTHPIIFFSFSPLFFSHATWLVLYYVAQVTGTPLWWLPIFTQRRVRPTFYKILFSLFS